MFYSYPQLIYSVIIIFFLFMLLLFLTCEKNTTSLTNQHITLSPEYTGVTEVMLQVNTNNIKLPSDYILFRNNEQVKKGRLHAGQNTVVDNSLLPSHIYTYQVKIYKNDALIGISNELRITTLDTTSHDFQWEVIEFPSPFASGVLLDVAIIDEDNIWAVGTINSDSLEPWKLSNAVHWDGNNWKLESINYGGYPWFIRSIWAFSRNNIWFDAFVKWDGSKYRQMPIPKFLTGVSIIEMWGNPTGELYIAVNSGNIVYTLDYGKIWQKLELESIIQKTAPENQIQDIWGIFDSNTEESVMLCPIGLKYQISMGTLLGIDSYLSVQEIALPTQNDSSRLYPHTVWFKNVNKIFVGGLGIHIRNMDDTWQSANRLKYYYFNKIRGNNINDVFGVGDFGRIVHFNGVDWFEYPQFNSILLYSVDVKNDVVVACGTNGRNAYIVIGMRK